MKCKKILSLLLAIIIVFSIPIGSFADNNAGSGDGQWGDATHGRYRYHEWMYKASIYVGLSDTADTKSSMSEFKQIGKSVYVEKDFDMPNNTLFTRYNKIDYLKGAPLIPDSNPIETIDIKVPRIPITHDGRLSSVKSYFGDTGTLIGIINDIAKHYGTSRERLVSDIEFTIDGEKGIQDPDIILPVKGEDGIYKNQVPWLIVYEPVTIAHLKDGKTKLAFTATEYALAQKQGMFNFFYNAPNAQYIANMTHANLPNSVVLERDWFNFRAYKPLGHNVKWSDDRIIKGGGWGMRFLRPNSTGEDGDPGRTEDIGEYRTDTDIVVSFTLQGGNIPKPQKESSPPRHLVELSIDGVPKKTQEVYLPSGGSQLVWIKFHTPKDPTTLNVSAKVVSQGSAGSFISDASTKRITTVNLDEKVPPDPRAEDPKTKKPVEKPKGFKVPKQTSKNERLSNEWGEYAPAWWVPNWVWHSNWVWIDTGTNEEGESTGYWDDRGDWVDEGEWNFYLNRYTATISKENTVGPDERVPTAKQQYGKWTMGSGYGYNVDSKIRVNHNASSSAVASQGNAVTLFPEFQYKEFVRLSERINDGAFKLKENKYSTFNNRVHFTPLWYPNDKYVTHTKLIDVWTPAGHLYTYSDEEITIKGSVLDDWKVVPSKVDRYK